MQKKLLDKSDINLCHYIFGKECIFVAKLLIN